jgi:hypothetical protein
LTALLANEYGEPVRSPWIARLLFGLALTTGCGAPPRSAPPAAPQAVVTVAPPRAPDPGPLDAIDLVAPTVVRVDVEALRKVPLFQAFQAVAQSFGQVSKADKQCGLHILDVPREVALSVSENGTVLAGTYDAPGDKALACLRAVSNGSDAKLEDGTPALQLDESTFAVFKGQLLYVGDSPGVRAALARSGRPIDAAAASPLALAGDAVAIGVFRGHDLPLTGMSAVVHASEEHFALDVTGDAETESAAEQLAQVVRQAMAEGKLDPEHLEALGVHDGASVLSVHGKTLELHLLVKGDVLQQGRAVAGIGSRAILAARKYIRGAKAAEAKATVAEIVDDLKAYVSGRAQAHQAPRFPASAAPVPTEVPRGKKYESGAGDWSGSWQSIGFSRSEPQYFRYSFVTADDGKHVVVRAEGDLNGDGKASLYEVPLEIGGKGQVVQGEPKDTPEPAAK